MKGINNSISVQKMIGSKIKLCREQRKLTRRTLCERLINSAKAPRESSPIDIGKFENRLKQWEYGNNPIDIEWIPAICDVLGCDVGYLFGDYAEYTRESADIVKETGLPKEAVEKLLKLPSFLKETLSVLICAESFGNIIQGIFTYKQMIRDVVKLAEDPSMGYGDFQRRKIVADAMEFQTTKELGKVFTDITENMFSCSDAIVKVDGGYKRVITYKEKKDG